MRQFKLKNMLGQEFDFINNDCTITDISGLGIEFGITETNGQVTNVINNFPDISLKIVYGIKKDAYDAYQELMKFINMTGKNKVQLMYSVKGDWSDTLYCDVWIKSSSKTQKIVFRVLEEVLVFKRVSYFYEIESGIIPKVEESFDNYRIEISNEFFDSMPINIKIKTPINEGDSLYIYLDGDYSSNSGVISMIHPTPFIDENGYIIFDNFNKKVYFKNLDTGTETNIYTDIEFGYEPKSRAFINVPQGKHSISINGIYSSEQQGTTEVVYEYRKLRL